MGSSEEGVGLSKLNIDLLELAQSLIHKMHSIFVCKTLQWPPLATQLLFNLLLAALQWPLVKHKPVFYFTGLSSIPSLTCWACCEQAAIE